MTEKKEKEETQKTESQNKELSEEKSDLEKDLEGINIDENKFRDVLININPQSPSLERAAISQEPLTNLETGLGQAPVVKEDKDEIKYDSINYEEKKGKSYAEKQEQKSENLIINTSISMAKDNPRELMQAQTKQEFQINPELQGMRKVQDDYAVKSPTGEFKETKTHDPFQKPTREYEFR